jgi:hypothetical protein
VDRRDRSPDHAHPPWPLPPLRSLHPVLADPPRWKPPRLVSRLSWDSSVRLSIDILSRAGPVGVAATGTCRDATPDALPLSWFRTTSAVDRLQKGAGLLHPAADHGVRRVSYCVPLLRTGQAGRRAHRHPRDAFRTPRRIPSPIAAPRHRGRCLPTVPPTSGHHPTAFAAGQGHRTPPPIRWALADRLLSRPPHITWGLLDDRSHRELPRHRSGPRYGRAPSPTLASRGGARLDRESGPFQGLAPPSEFVLRAPDWLPATPARFFLGFVPLQGPPAIALAGADRHRHRRSGRGHRAPIRRPADACRARCDEDHTRRQAWGAEDTGKPGPRPDATLAGRAPRFSALAGPGTESLRGFTWPPLARRPGAPGVCPEPKWARRVRRFLPGCPSSE